MAKRIITVANQKGGCGKTTTSENLAAALAVEGHKVLAVDYDPQRSLTRALEHEEDEGIVHVGSGFDLMLGDPMLAAHDFSGVDELWTELEDLTDSYDYIVIDAPPGVSMATMNAMYPADTILVPTQASYLAVVGIEDLAGVVGTLNEHGATITDIKVLLTMYDGRNGDTREMERQIREAWPVLETVIRRNIALSYAQAAGCDIFEYDQRSNGANDYLSLAHELLNA